MYFVRWVKPTAQRLCKGDVLYTVDAGGYLCVDGERVQVADRVPFQRPLGVYVTEPVSVPPELQPLADAVSMPEPTPDPVVVSSPVTIDMPSEAAEPTPNPVVIDVEHGAPPELQPLADAVSMPEPTPDPVVVLETTNEPTPQPRRRR